MSPKSLVKRLITGRPGLRPRRIRRGLLAGLSFFVDPAVKSQRLLGLDEAEIAGPVRDLCREARSALDVGANDGWYSLYFASRPNIERVVAFEPEATLLAAVSANFRLNDPAFARKLTCRRKLVGNADDDTWCSVDAEAADLPRPVLLKVDVDGGEGDVLRGAGGLLAAGAALLVVETHSPELEAECMRVLRSHGYEAKVLPRAWYRRFVPEARRLEHNRWLVARPRRGGLP